MDAAGVKTGQPDGISCNRTMKIFISDFGGNSIEIELFLIENKVYPEALGCLNNTHLAQRKRKMQVKGLQRNRNRPNIINRVPSQ